MREFPDRFTGIGKFPGEYKIWLHSDAHPVIHTPRKCPVALCPKVEEHLAKMEALGVITHIDQPTDWVLPNTYIQKANGELCLCLDLHDLNRAICHDHHKMPTVEEVAHKFANLHYFTKLDACHGYWSIVLDEESSILTTFNSPFGRYHFLHLPFGLVCSEDIFQKKMDQFLKDCPGCIGIADNITVHGHTEAEHDAHLQDLMKVACKYWFVFNPQKMHVKAPAINFFGCLYDANGVHPDLKKADVCMLSQHPQMSKNSKSSLAWWHTSAPSSMVCPPWPPLCENSWEKMLTSPGMPAMRPLLSKSTKPLLATPPSDTSTCHCLWPYKSMLPR